MTTTQQTTAGKGSKGTLFMEGDRVYSVGIPSLTGTLTFVGDDRGLVKWDSWSDAVKWELSDLEYWTRPESAEVASV